MNYIKFVLIYFTFITLLSVLLTLYDKFAAKKHLYRVSEFTLMFTGLLGGAFAEYLTMLIIRHKTKHKKFMVGLPVEIVLHILIISAVAYLYFR